MNRKQKREDEKNRRNLSTPNSTKKYKNSRTANRSKEDRLNKVYMLEYTEDKIKEELRKTELLRKSI
jgi:hypothetical protein